MSMLSSTHRAALEASGCEVRFDDLTRMLYATDASIYRVEPGAVAFPRTAAEAAAIIRAAADENIGVIPRGAGTGLTGGAIGEGVVVDLARRNRDIGELDLEERTIRVGAGVVLDQLNAHLRAHGMWFGPDVATSSRATIGGMIGNNSSGSHAPVYGTTVDHVSALEIVLADGSVEVVHHLSGGLADIRDGVDRIVDQHADHISRRFPEGLVKRWSGYGLDDARRRPGDLSRIVCGSEGTLAAVFSAVVEVVPLPRHRTLGVLFFDSVPEAMQATVELSDLEAAAIEHIDRVLVDQTLGQLGFSRARRLLGLDADPAEAILLVEFFDDADDRLALLDSRRLGRRTLICREAPEQEMVWAVRRAGLSLLTGCAGPAKPTTCIEDVCVRPERLPEYVAGLEEILGGLGLKASYYGHAASGLLHVRPVLDLHRSEDVDTLRRVSDEVSDLCRRFGGSLAAEHGVGIARTEYLEAHVGSEILDASRQIKALFDPRGVMNPGKIIDSGRFKIDRDLRLGAGSSIDLPFDGQLGFIHKDRSFVGNLEQCNGCGGCRKDAPTMCPTFVATGEEIQSTRGRANTIRAALDGRFGPRPLIAEELDEALSNCLSCKACRAECPSNVDLAALKAELMHARHRLEGPPIKDRVIAAADRLGRVGTLMPRLANAVLASRGIRRLMEMALGLNASRPLPRYADQRFDVWFRARRAPRRSEARGTVVLWDDTWVRYHEPGVGQAAVTVLEAAGYEVRIAEDRRCCGRPAFSRGLLDQARRAGEHNVRLFARQRSAEPIVFLEPSCWSMFVDEYLQLGVDGADEVAQRCVLFENFVENLLEGDPGALSLNGSGAVVAIHDHCHAKALRDRTVTPRLAGRIPGAAVELLDTGCCGMAGAFGMLKSKDELSRAVAEPLVRLIGELPEGTELVASGTSCRHQIEHLTEASPLHVAELLAAHLIDG